ncbi:MAG: YqhA family protein [Magnetococcales bacterium]|nr:YqhA family protein [Magnetococcales bacterium]
MFKLFFSLRYISLVVVVFSFVGAVVMSLSGVMETLDAVKSMAGMAEPDAAFPAGMSGGEVAMIRLIEATDRFLFALVLMIFSYGTYTLFIRRGGGPEEDEEVPGWMRFKSIGELKVILAQVIIVMLYVRFLHEMMHAADLDWKQLVIPAAVVMLSLGLKLIHSDHK